MFVENTAVVLAMRHGQGDVKPDACTRGAGISHIAFLPAAFVENTSATPTGPVEKIHTIRNIEVY